MQIHQIAMEKKTHTDIMYNTIATSIYTYDKSKANLNEYELRYY